MGQAVRKAQSGEKGSESGEVAVSFKPLHEVINAGLQEKVFPGGSCVVAQSNAALFSESYGQFSYAPVHEEDEGIPPVRTHSVYDIDSITSSVITTTLLMKALEEGRVQLTDRVTRYVHGFGVFGKSPVRIIDLLRHTSGLAATEALYQQVDSVRKDTPFGTPVGRGVAQHLYMLINRMQPRTTVGNYSQYSELGMITLGHLLEELWGRRLDQLANEYILKPLQIQGSGFIDHNLVRQGKFGIDRAVVTPSEDCPWRKRTLQGEVRDENTWAMGGVSGEAGFFGNAEDVTIIVQALLNSYRGVTSRFVSPLVVKQFFRVDPEAAGPWALGWASARAAFGVEPPAHFKNSLGAVSSSGCGVWFDPESSLSIVFLSNMSMPNRSNRRAAQFWPKLLKGLWASVSS